MTYKPRNFKDEDSPYARITRNFLLRELSCSNLRYEFNEAAQNGTIIAIAGDDYAIIAADARHTDDANQTLHKITNRLVLASTGCQCHTAKLASLLRARMFMNEYMRRRVMPAKCVAMLLSCLLTNHTCCHKHISFILAGLDENGKGVIYAYDPLGYNTKTKYRALGVANAVIQPILNKRLAAQPKYNILASQSSDMQKGGRKRVSRNSQSSTSRLSKLDIKDFEERKLGFDEAFELIECTFKHAAKFSDIYMGHLLVLNGITKHGCLKHEIMIKEPGDCIEEWC